MVATARTPSQRRLTPAIQSMPGQDRAEDEGRAEVGLHHDQGEWRPDEQAGTDDRPDRIELAAAAPRGSSARTTIIRILASSLNWNVNGPSATQRADPPIPSPIARVNASNPSWTA